MRTNMSGFANMSMTNAIAENAAVPTKSVDSSTVRTNRGDRGAPRSSSHNAANAALATNSSTLLRLNESRPSQSDSEKLSAMKPRPIRANTRPNLERRNCLRASSVAPSVECMSIIIPTPRLKRFSFACINAEPPSRRDREGQRVRSAKGARVLNGNDAQCLHCV